MPDVSVQDGKVLLRRRPDERKPIVQRLNRIEGQLRGVRLMIEEDRHCSEEILQLKAAIAALREVATIILEQHVEATAGVVVSTSSSPEGDRDTALRDMLRVLRDGTKL